MGHLIEIELKTAVEETIATLDSSSDLKVEPPLSKLLSPQQLEAVKGDSDFAVLNLFCEIIFQIALDAKQKLNEASLEKLVEHAKICVAKMVNHETNFLSFTDENMFAARVALIFALPISHNLINHVVETFSNKDVAVEPVRYLIPRPILGENNILHLAAYGEADTLLSAIHLADTALKDMDTPMHPYLMKQPNDDGDLPLHIAVLHNALSGEVLRSFNWATEETYETMVLKDFLQYENSEGKRPIDHGGRGAQLLLEMLPARKRMAAIAGDERIQDVFEDKIDVKNWPSLIACLEVKHKKRVVSSIDFLKLYDQDKPSFIHILREVIQGAGSNDTIAGYLRNIEESDKEIILSDEVPDVRSEQSNRFFQKRDGDLEAESVISARSSV